MDQRITGFLGGVVLVSAFWLGTLSSRTVAPAEAQVPATHVQRWEYMCTEGRNIETIHARFTPLGRDGWELAAVGLASGVWCFKRPIP